MITGERIWWPLPKRALYLGEATAYCNFLLSSRIHLDDTLLQAAEAALTHTLYYNVSRILQSDLLPILSHLINGWGDGTFQRDLFFDSYTGFLHRTNGGHYKILQRHSEGDFHPWQSIAYAVMAGISRSARLRGGQSSLRSVAKQSLDLGSDDPAELGHFLFAVGPLGLAHPLLPVQFGPRSRPLCEIVKLAIQAHLSGSFSVCRKIHLTEGLCAASMFVPEFERYRPIAQEFLNTQLDILVVLGTALWLHSEEHGRANSSRTIDQIQRVLAIGKIFENYVFYVGHLLELAAFARLLGYKISAVHEAALCYAANWIAQRIPLALQRSEFMECLYQYGHFRRGATLLKKLFSGHSATPIEWSAKALRKFTVNLDEPLATETGRNATPDSWTAKFNFVETTVTPHPLLSDSHECDGPHRSGKTCAVGTICAFSPPSAEFLAAVDAL